MFFLSVSSNSKQEESLYQTSTIMTTQDQGRTALLLIDVQEGFKHPSHWGKKRSNPNCEANISRILSAFREASTTSTTAGVSQKPLVIHVQHISESPISKLHPDYKTDSWRGIDFQSCAKPLSDGSEPIIQKHVNSALIGTDLEAMLRRECVGQLVIAGLTTDHCVSTSTRMAANLKVTEGPWGPGRVVLVGDATATFEKGDWDAETVQAVHLASLKGEFAEIWSTEEVLRWIRDQ